ncbi:MAG: hypothetical protein ACLGIA_13410 [Actinomycetes bacterium]
MRTTTRPRALGLAIVVAVVPMTSCASAKVPAVDEVASAFYAAVADSDGAGACHLLAPKTRDEVEESAGSPCDQAVLDQVEAASGSVTSTTVYGDQALVRLEEDTVFLARYAPGWRVVAAGCTARKDEPYQCSLKGS